MHKTSAHLVIKSVRKCMEICIKMQVKDRVISLTRGSGHEPYWIYMTFKTILALKSRICIGNIDGLSNYLHIVQIIHS